MTLSDGEKLILAMLCDIHKALQIKGDVDVDSIRSSIDTGNAVTDIGNAVANTGKRQPGNEPSKEVGQILEMWSAIERGYKRLSLEEKEQVEAEAGPLGRGVRFSGFDDETECNHRDAAHALIEELGRFERFQGRNLTAHMPMLDGYRRMLRLFASIGPVSAETRLDVRQIISLANAEKYPG